MKKKKIEDREAQATVFKEHITNGVLAQHYKEDVIQQIASTVFGAQCTDSDMAFTYLVVSFQFIGVLI